MARNVLEQPYTVGGGGGSPPGPHPPPPPRPPPPPPLPMFEADSQNFALALSRGFKLKHFGPAFGGDHKGTLGGEGSQPKPPSDPTSPPYNTSLPMAPDHFFSSKGARGLSIYTNPHVH